MDVDFEILTGRTDRHVVRSYERLMHKDIVPALTGLKEKAKAAGFDLLVVSAFRSFEHQCRIWNAKAEGKRTLLDEKGNPLDYRKLSREELLETILNWSAIPGTSRHHWGSDIDIFDAKAIPSSDYQVQLTPQEVKDDGIFGPLHKWLDEQIENDEAHGFFRPYRVYKGGVHPERWHLSYAPLSEPFLKHYDLATFKRNIADSSMALSDLILERADELYEKFVMNIDPPEHR